MPNEAGTRNKLRAQRLVLAMPFCTDTCVGRTTIERPHVVELQQMNPSVTVQVYENTVVNETMTDHEVTCMTPVHLRFAEYGSRAVSLHEPIVKNQSLCLLLGIDIVQQLEKLAVEDQEDADVEVEDDLPTVSSRFTNQILWKVLGGLV
ncbi:hypothetical protein PHMEG_0009598 [Phytophthora megakarya]|uniref:Uncharacterized protein n=1 Tax=Phytophthora megakarya TaxID=4795 RepID=A0A225WFU9_9STRA|nr:hypothetical protein PHMEG_0009598 [Phytophthora megakarya]